MLRTWDEKGGVAVYTHNVMRELTEIDRRNRYFLYYRNPGNLGTFLDAGQRERASPSRSQQGVVGPGDDSAGMQTRSHRCPVPSEVHRARAGSRAAP